MEDRNERDGNPEELNRKQQRDVRAFIDFLVRHPERRKQFIREVVNAGAPGRRRSECWATRTCSYR